MDSWSEQVRAAVEADPRSRSEISRLAGIERAALSRFVSGKRDMLLDNAGRLAQVVGLTISKGSSDGKA